MKKERMLGDRCHVKLEFEMAKEENTEYGRNRLYALGSKISNITCSLMIMIAIYPRSSIYKCYFNGKWSLKSKRTDVIFFHRNLSNFFIAISVHSHNWAHLTLMISKDFLLLSFLSLTLIQNVPNISNFFCKC